MSSAASTGKSVGRLAVHAVRRRHVRWECQHRRHLGEDFGDEFERKINYGASFGWMGHGAIGFEVDFGYSPNFFRISPDNGSFDLVGDSNVTTLMGNVLVGAPIGGVRPYASGGVGLIRSHVEDVGGFFEDDGHE